MIREFLEDTIAAISTPMGEGGIGIVRLSGKDSIRIADKIFRAKSTRKVIDIKTFTTSYGFIFENDRRIDEVILTVMKAPLSYTKEDIVEINCHGGIVPLREVLELTIREGARPAEPGEFTKRAFLNGRIDLLKAEAVLDVIRAKTDLSLKFAVRQLEGRLSERINSIKEKILDIQANLEVAIDFSDEDIEFRQYELLIKGVEGVISEVDTLVRESDFGIISKDGVLAVICGKPNTGKSTLLNTLLKKDRAIVTSIPGTTRDTIEELLNIKGIQVRIVDTAGVTETKDPIEQEGISRTKRYLDDADIAILLLDNSTLLNDDDMRMIELLKEQKNLIVAINKIDLANQLDINKAKKVLPERRTVKICAKDASRISELEEEIVDIVLSGKVIVSDEAIITNARHRNALLKTKESLFEAKEDLVSKKSEEFISVNVKEALDQIGTITGEVCSEELLDKIFSEFCIGK